MIIAEATPRHATELAAFDFTAAVSKLFDKGTDLYVQKQQAKIARIAPAPVAVAPAPAPVAPARVPVAPVMWSAPRQTVFGMDQKTVMVGGAALLLALILIRRRSA